ncbi:putative reverse transcriptase domain-containing protein [Tanacetum coccineum]
MLEIKIFSERKKIYKERKKCEKIRAKRSDIQQGMEHADVHDFEAVKEVVEINEVKDMIDVNLVGTFNVVKAALPGMKNRIDRKPVLIACKLGGIEPKRNPYSSSRKHTQALSSALEHIVTASDPGFSDWQWRLSTLPFAFRGLGAYSACDVLNYAFLAAFNAKMEIDLLSNPSQVVALKLMKKLADIYFTRVTQMVESTFSQSTRQMALWKSQMEDHTSDWLRVVLISGVFAEDIYGDHVVSCDGIVSIKHRYNLVRDTLVDICFRYGISVGKEVDVGLGRAMIEDAQHKSVKYKAKCVDIRYGFLPFSFSSFGELESDVVTLLKRI